MAWRDQEEGRQIMEWSGVESLSSGGGDGDGGDGSGVEMRMKILVLTHRCW